MTDAKRKPLIPVTARRNGGMTPGQLAALYRQEARRYLPPTEQPSGWHGPASPHPDDRRVVEIEPGDA